MESDSHLPEPPPDAETTVERRTWTEPNPGGGLPTSFERTVTTTTWSTTTEYVVDGSDPSALSFSGPAPVERPVSVAKELDEPSGQAAPPSASQEPHLPGVPPARKGWLDRLRGR